MHDCTGSTCGLRFPAPVGHPGAARCPRCGAPTTASDPVPNPPPTASDQPDDQDAGPRVAGLLDNVRSVLNVGAMFRTADAAGLSHLHLCGITAPGDHDGLDKTALGAQHVVPWTAHARAPDAVDALRAEGWEVWALEARPGAQALDVVAGATSGATRRANGPHAVGRPDARGEPVDGAETTPVVAAGGIVVVVGHEVAGIDPAVLARADRVVAIPMHGTKRSLNVATAFGIAAYAARGVGRPPA